MKDRRNATKAELNYSLRRVVYDIMVASKSVASLSASGNDYSEKEMAKMTALLMARNLNAFLFVHEYVKDDDINVTDFINLSSWTPSPSACMSEIVKQRIHKIVGHIVASKPSPFKDDEEIRNTIIPIIEQACNFVRECLAQNIAKYTGEAPYYVRRLNGLLPQIGLAKLPEV